MRHGNSKFLPYSCLFGVVALIWIWARSSSVVPALLVPEPTRVVHSLWALVLSDPSVFGITALRAIGGTTLGLGIGAGLAVLSHLVPPFSPLAQILGMVMRCVPVPALAPVIAILFGYGGPAAVATSAVMSSFPAYTLVGGALRALPSASVDLVRVVGGQRWQIFRHVGVPVALAELALAAKLTASLAILATLTAEFLTANDGLGALLTRSQGLLDTPTVWAILLVSLASSFLCYEAMDIVERALRGHLSLHRI